MQRCARAGSGCILPWDQQTLISCWYTCCDLSRDYLWNSALQAAKSTPWIIIKLQLLPRVVAIQFLRISPFFLSVPIGNSLFLFFFSPSEAEKMNQKRKKITKAEKNWDQINPFYTLYNGNDFNTFTLYLPLSFVFPISVRPVQPSCCCWSSVIKSGWLFLFLWTVSKNQQWEVLI